jgi:hypothetical protein
VIFRLLRHLVGIAVALTLVSGVTTYFGPQLAARSMSGYVAQLDAADHGDTAQVSAIGADLRREWLRLEATVTDALSRADDQLGELLP